MRHPITVALLGGWIYGYNTGVIAGINSTKGLVYSMFGENDPNSSVYSGLLTASILIGAIFGTYGGVAVADKLGRTKALSLCGLTCSVFAALLAIIDNFWIMCGLRLCLGVAVGGVACVCPMYVNETVPSTHAGKIGTLFQVSICATILLAEVVNYFGQPDASVPLTPFSWKVQFALGAVPGVLVLLYSPMMPESPTWLAKQAHGGDFQQLIDPGFENAQSDTPNTVRSQTKLSLMSAGGIKWLLVGGILAMANQFTGINAVIFYANNILENPILVFSVIGIWNLACVFVSFALVDRLGRRPLMLSALCLMALGAFTLGISTLIEMGDAEKTIVLIGSIMVVVMAFEIGPGPLFFVMATESFPSEISQSAVGFTNAMAWVFNLAVSFGFPVLLKFIGLGGCFFVFGSIALLTAVLIFFLVPETKGKKEMMDRDNFQRVAEAGECGGELSLH